MKLCVHLPSAYERWTAYPLQNTQHALKTCSLKFNTSSTSLSYVTTKADDIGAKYKAVLSATDTGGMGTHPEFPTDNPAGMSFAREYEDTITKLQNLKLLALHPRLPNLMGKKKQNRKHNVPGADIYQLRTACKQEF